MYDPGTMPTQTDPNNRTLRDTPLFKDLSDQELKSMIAILKLIELRDGEVLFEQGDDSEKVFIVQRGVIRITAVHDGVEETYTKLGMGAVFGEIGVMKTQPRTATARAVGETHLLAFEGKAFVELMERFPTIQKIVLATMFGRFRADAQRAEARRRRREGLKIASVFSATGGAGASTVAASCACTLAQLTNQRVALLDFDLMFGDQGVLFGDDENVTLSDVIMNSELDLEALDEIVRKTDYGVDLIKAPHHPEHAEFVDPGFLERLLTILAHRYEWIFLDTPRHLTDVGLDLLDRSEVRLYVMTPGVGSVRNAGRWMDVANRLGVPIDDLRIVVNKVTEDDEATLEYLRKRYGERIAGEVPMDPKLVARAYKEGKPLTVHSPASTVGGALRKVAGGLVGVELGGPLERPAFFETWL